MDSILHGRSVPTLFYIAVACKLAAITSLIGHLPYRFLSVPEVTQGLLK